MYMQLGELDTWLEDSWNQRLLLSSPLQSYTSPSYDGHNSHILKFYNVFLQIEKCICLNFKNVFV